MVLVRIRSIHYAWVVAAVTFLVLVAVAGIRSASGVLLVPLEREMGWTAAAISVAIAINIALYGAVGPFAAAFMERLGIRTMVLIALALTALATATSALVMTPLELSLTWGVGLGLGVGVVSMVLAAVISTRWFATRRGLVYGALTGATAMGQLVFLPLLAAVAHAWGWRAVGFACAAVALAAAIPVALLMRDRPQDVGLQRFGETPENAAPPPRHGGNPLRNTFAVLGRAARKRDFWLVAGTFFCCGATTNGYIGTHFMAICGDAGIPQVRAAGYVAVIGLFSMLGSTASGWLSDRYASRYLLFTYYGLRGLSLFALPFALTGPASALLLPAFMVFYGLDWLATGAPNMRALGEALAKEDVPIAFGWIGVAHQMGAGLSTYVAGYLRTLDGSYAPTYDIFGCVCVIAALASLAIGTGRRSVRAKPDRPAPSGRAVPA